MSDATARVPDEVLAQIANPLPGSDGPVTLICAIGLGMDCQVHHVRTDDLARDLRDARAALRGLLVYKNGGRRECWCDDITQRFKDIDGTPDVHTDSCAAVLAALPAVESRSKE